MIRYVTRCTNCGSITIDGLVVDMQLKQIRLGDRVAHVKPRVLAVAERLVAGAGQVVRHQALIDHVWGDEVDGGPDAAQRAISLYVSTLRRAFEAIGAPLEIRVVHTVGYRLVMTSDGGASLEIAADTGADPCLA